MADSTVIDYSKMKVTELRKELKSRNMITTGDKAELITRLQNADFNLDSDDNDSDGVLDDDLRSSQDFDEPALLSDEEISPTIKKDVEKPSVLKRKISETAVATKTEEKTDVTAKKIVLNRTSSTTEPVEKQPKSESEIQSSKPAEKVKIKVDSDPKARLEMRAKRFGINSADDKKEMRKQRFGVSSSTDTKTISEAPTAADEEKLKKRAERFGVCVSSKLIELTNKEKLQRRAEKFGLVK